MCLDSILTISKTNELTKCDYQKRDITPTNQPTTKFLGGYIDLRF